MLALAYLLAVRMLRNGAARRVQVGVGLTLARRRPANRFEQIRHKTFQLLHAHVTTDVLNVCSKLTWCGAPAGVAAPARSVKNDRCNSRL